MTKNITAIGGLAEISATWFEVFTSSDGAILVWKSCDTYQEAEDFLSCGFARQLKNPRIRMENGTAYNIGVCNHWVEDCDGETSYWRYPPGGGISEAPSLPKGFEIDEKRSNPYWVIRRKK